MVLRTEQSIRRTFEQENNRTFIERAALNLERAALNLLNAQH
jgi:hypothetical protein